MTFRFKYRFVRGTYESQDGYKLDKVMQTRPAPVDHQPAVAGGRARSRYVDQLTTCFPRLGQLGRNASVHLAP